METFSVLLTLCKGIHWLTAVPPNDGPVMRSFGYFWQVDVKHVGAHVMSLWWKFLFKSIQFRVYNKQHNDSFDLQ